MEIKKDILEKGAVIQRDKKTYAIAPHIPGGIIFDVNVLRKIADVAEKYGAQALKLTSAQRIAIVGIDKDQIDNAWKDLDMDKGHAVGLCVRSVKICPATHFCKRAQQDAVSIGLELDAKYHGMQLPSKFKMGISGCLNSCSESAVKDLGLIGTPKGFTVLIGGSAGVKARIADVLQEHVPVEAVLALVDKVVLYYKANGKNYERMGNMIERLGIEKVKHDILG
ncbi:nitrite/sulfite reductase domain-containing protein [Pelosinus propionicus]|uniref:Nitrite/Sulfite reductase ferredoxin-like half domain-containing protein n=1 Tax=Pelosinus propionicus DSM 13327 TaxID=1123291 RepID=A0A1I4LJD6_9FIRM|nr:NAD(P)/FAD-dependent oxidoreductase [Pelosinus propionicus]SFL91228.1 Nitrite/Sulfite reductase ferredoxin-like half domain-containing protein [Pelosinus propionicus DSM 13327]